MIGLGFTLIGSESGVSFLNQSESVVKQNQSKHITFDTQLKTALLYEGNSAYEIFQIYCLPEKWFERNFTKVVA